MRRSPRSIYKHIFSRRRGRNLSKVEYDGVSLFRQNQHVTAAANVACSGVRHCQGEGSGDGRIDGIATAF